MKKHHTLGEIFKFIYRLKRLGFDVSISKDGGFFAKRGFDA
ncbi:hypothetical protein LMG7974_01633 [Campylobacter majalis]|uniref:Uncharacterized protein n=1 Tax=Campylobacter majalis TaxID=2790656 RepID=A0ABM8Q9L7_9BACT|nr:hypothetical protein [Campylobacter majalis]CAD7289556.1 hypothetical protein LMG7974_01633 [Campylobacter majalis]